MGMKTRGIRMICHVGKIVVVQAAILDAAQKHPVLRQDALLSWS
jgi:hypothetical protein